jgi:nitrite reductase/ring-hydroxylating ferredoxin subunit
MTTSTETQAPEGYTFVCKRDAIPARGKKTIRVGEITLLLITCESGLYAIEDRCPQTGGSIAHGEVIGCDIITPTRARYCLKTGRYLGGGETLLQLQSHWLTIYALKVIGDQVYVRLPQIQAKTDP